MRGVVMTKEKKVSEPKAEPKAEKKAHPKFTCNVNFNNKEYKKGEEWTSEVPEAIKSFLE